MKRIYLICCIMVFLLGGCRNQGSPQQLSLSDESEEINSFTSSSEELLLEEEYYHYDLFEHVYGFNLWQNTFVLKKDNQIFTSIQLRSKQLIIIITLASIFFQREPYTAFRCKIRTLKQFSAAMELSHFSL